jgi:hypothetical protein
VLAARQQKVEDGSWMRTDTTVVESNTLPRCDPKRSVLGPCHCHRILSLLRGNQPWGTFGRRALPACDGATKSAKSGDGDAVLDGCNIEVKKATAATLNQVRAVKYIPLAALHEPTDTWYVVPAHVIVCLASSKRRGQHTENPFESATLNIFALGKYRVAADKDLKQATLNALAEAKKYPDLKKAMETVLKGSKDLAASSIKDVSALIMQLKIVP